MQQLKKDIRRHFPYLFEERRFEFVDLADDYEGNIAIAQCDNLRIRFVRDRADFFLEIGYASEPDSWTEFYKILDWLKAKRLIATNYKYSNKIGNVSKLFEQHFSEVCSESLSSDATILALPASGVINSLKPSLFSKRKFSGC